MRKCACAVFVALLAVFAGVIAHQLHTVGVFRTISGIPTSQFSSCTRKTGAMGVEDLQIFDGVAFLSSDDRVGV